MSAAVREALGSRLDSGGARRTFGELTQAEVAERASELGSATGFGHRSRVAGVATAWGELAGLMAREGAATVAALDAESLEPLLERLWIRPPGGSLLP